MPLDDKKILKQQIATAVNNAPQQSNLTDVEKRALKDLTEDTKITIAPADKGRVTVVLNTSDYIQKCQDHLNDSNVYTKVDVDPTNSLKNKMNKLLM